MIPHKTRLLVLSVFAVIVLALLAAGSFLDLDADTKSLLSTILEGIAGVLVVGGVMDSRAVDRRRRDPAQSALPDDVTEEEEGLS